MKEFRNGEEVDNGAENRGYRVSSGVYVGISGKHHIVTVNGGIARWVDSIIRKKPIEMVEGEIYYVKTINGDGWVFRYHNHTEDKITSHDGAINVADDYASRGSGRHVCSNDSYSELRLATEKEKAIFYYHFPKPVFIPNNIQFVDDNGDFGIVFNGEKNIMYWGFGNSEYDDGVCVELFQEYMEIIDNSKLTLKKVDKPEVGKFYFHSDTDNLERYSDVRGQYSLQTYDGYIKTSEIAFQCDTLNSKWNHYYEVVYIP